jgi:phosphatidate cytidylyltransferase
MTPTLIGVAAMAIGSCMPMFFPRDPGTCPLGMFGGAASGLVAAVVLLAVVGLMEHRASSGARTDGIARGVLAAAYMFPLIAFLAPHRLLHDHNGSGLCALILILATSKMSDAWAYGFGKLLGRTKMAPLLSPNKTIEGGLGGLLGGVVGALIVFWLVAPYVAGTDFSQGFLWIVGYGVIVSLAGVAGDLFESLLKRDSGCKDSSGWFPGLGGILDIVDSIVFAAPASWLYWVVTGAI